MGDGTGADPLPGAPPGTPRPDGPGSFTLPPGRAGWIGTLGAGAERTDIESLVTRTAFAGTRWHTIEERSEGLDTEVRAELLHAVACHHELRAARTAEAAALYHANQLDAVAATIMKGRQ